MLHTVPRESPPTLAVYWNATNYWLKRNEVFTPLWVFDQTLYLAGLAMVIISHVVYRMLFRGGVCKQLTS